MDPTRTQFIIWVIKMITDLKGIFPKVTQLPFWLLHPWTVAFSCHIWSWATLKQICPQTAIISFLWQKPTQVPTWVGKAHNMAELYLCLRMLIHSSLQGSYMYIFFGLANHSYSLHAMKMDTSSWSQYGVYVKPSCAGKFCQCPICNQVWHL